MIVFFPIKVATQKLSRIIQIAEKHTHQKDPLLFLVSDKNSFDFLDHLLWSTPPEGFLPHPTPLIEISYDFNPQFPTIFNLRPEPLLKNVKMIYEFEDHTSSEKIQLSKQRYETYRDQNYQIVIEG